MAPELLGEILYRKKVCPTTDITFWTEERIKHISVNCLHRILTENKAPVKLDKLWEKIDWSVISKFTDEMKPSLRKIDLGDFCFMQPGVLSRISSVPGVCATLGVGFWTEEKIENITAGCLHDILKEAQGTVKLETLWEKIDWSVISKFTGEMKPTLLKIDLGDFCFMQPDALSRISSVPGVCSALGVGFWNEKTIKGISAQCLHYILKEAQGTVKLETLWEKIDWSVIDGFTDEMKPSLHKIDLGDFCFMQPDALSLISSVPGICSALGAAFWTEETIKGISGDCLYELLTKYEEPIKLGDMWKNVPISCYDLLEKPAFSLDSVHPDDRILAGEWIKKLIEPEPHLCQSLSTFFWNEETIKYMTASCLYHALDETRRPFALGRLWDHVSPMAVQGFLKLGFGRLKNVAGNDFQYMSSSLLQSIFLSEQPLDCLPQPPTEIVLSARVGAVSMGPLQFAELVRLAPSVAGQLLWYSTKFPENVLSNCEGGDIRKLKLAIPGEAELDWNGLFVALESKYSLDGRTKSFAKMIQSISENAVVHFCATLSDPDEYLSLTWLHSNMVEECRKALPFDPERVHNLFSTLHLSAESHQSWGNRLGVYSNADWTLLSQSKRVATLIGKDCEFWRMVETGGWSSVFMALDSLVFKSIIPECVLKIPRILANNPERIPLLADDAFSKHTAGQLSCRLNSLSPAQIALLSTGTVKNIDKPSAEEISQHVLSGVVLDELKALNLQQFKSLCGSQWVFVAGSIKEDALNWQLDSALSRILDSASNLKSKGLDYNGGASNHFKTIEDTLSLVMGIYKDTRQAIPESPLALLIASFRDSDLRETFIKIFDKSTLLKPAIIGLVRDAQELRDYNHKTFKMIDTGETKLALLHDGQSGFDRSAVIELVSKTPELFAAPRARVSSQGITDTGGAIRALTDQLLNDIERDLVVPYGKGPKARIESKDKMAPKADGNPDMMQVNYSETDFENGAQVSRLKIKNSRTSNVMFVWGISKGAGLIVGIALGKALQLDIQLPFGLDLHFYELLIDTSDKAIESYYETTYSQEISKYRQIVLDLLKAGDLDTLSDIIPRLDSLCFTGLSTKTSAEEAKQDKTAKTNLWGCSDEDCYEDTKELEGEKFMEKYIETVLEKTQEEFKEFVRELVKGLGTALPFVKEFRNLPLPVLRPFAEFLPGLLNAEPISGEDILAKVDFEGNIEVPSLVQDKTIAARQVFSAFVLSLGTRQLEHLIGLWTGSSTLLLKYSELKVTFMPAGGIPSYQVNLCEAGKSDYLFASVKEYQEFFTKFSQKLLGASVKASPGCEPERASIIPVRPSTCAKNLMVYLQPAEQMLNSLIDLLRTPLTTLWDNQ